MTRTAFRKSTIALILLSVQLLPAASFAKGESEVKAGIDAYTKRDYKAAAEHFRQAIAQGNRSAAAWVYAGHTFMALGQVDQAQKTYETVVKSFKDSPEAKIAEQGLETIKLKPKKGGATAPGPGPVVDPAPAGNGLKDRISVTPPKWGHPPVNPKNVEAIRNAIANLPPRVRRTLDESTASISISPNMIDKWPESIKDLPEDKEELNLAEVPGRIYVKEMNVYERAKVRGSTALKAARTTSEMRHTVLNECSQVLDDLLNISRDPELRKEYNLDKAAVTPSAQDRLKTFLKEDDWGPRETCAELMADLLGEGGEWKADLDRYFARTKKWLKARLGI